MSVLDPSQKAFETAKRAFKDDLKDDKMFKEILKTTTIDKVWQLAHEIQGKQDSQTRLRHLGRMRSCLTKLEGYAAAIETFVQVKPDITALIWGPIRLLMLWTSNITKFADTIVEVMEKIGDALPYFLDVAKTFSMKDKFSELLALFFRDILDFYSITLKFFGLSRAKAMFEAIWPKQKGKIEVVIANIERHTSLMRNDVTLMHIKEEHEARMKALAHYDQESEFRERQQFRSLEASINPPRYEKRLDDVLNRSCHDSTRWLIRDKGFIGWRDMSNQASRLLWLHGIPGAGKTFLTAAAIEEAKCHHRTLFGFASHLYKDSMTARSILLSLIFQLAADFRDAQSVLVQGNERDLSGNTKYVAARLKELLSIAGHTYIIIDGMDEMEAIERRILLQQLTELDACTDTKVLVSSRPEDDIARFLESKALAICANKRNSAGIQSYATQRINTWMDQGGFDDTAQGKIRQLLAPLAARSQGMFLYARIVLDNVELLTGFEEIERELQAMPHDLKDAYHRIFIRINGLQPTLRQKARKILGWIDSAPVPMTRQELEQALLVDSSSDAAPAVSASVNFVGICGPIVEVLDEKVQFVHFTMLRYFFSREIDDFIPAADANHSLTCSSLAYLSSGIASIELSNDQIRDNILTGRYRLFDFAARQWITLTRRCVKTSKDLSAYPSTLTQLRLLALELRNTLFEGQVELEDEDFMQIESMELDICQIICGILQFRQAESHLGMRHDNAREWVNADPSILSTTGARIYNQLECLLCTSEKHREICHCATLRKHYGPKLFKCPYPSCAFNREGYDNRRDRQKHIENHGQPWKCYVKGCPLATVGYSTRRGVDEHWRKVHQPVVTEAPNLNLDGFSDEEWQVLLFELTKANDINSLHQLGPQFLSYLDGRGSWRSDLLAFPALLLAAKMGSLLMVETLARYMRGRATVESENVDLFRWFLSRVTAGDKPVFYGPLLAPAFATASEELYAELEDYLLNPKRLFRNSRPREFWEWIPAKELIPQHEIRSVLFSGSAFTATKKSEALEARLVQTWSRLIGVLGGGPLNPQFLGWSLRCLAQSSCSITMATELLRLGAPINFPGPRSCAIPQERPFPEPGTRRQKRLLKKRKGMTALHLASRRASEKASHFIRFLLERGADPEYGYGDMKPAQEIGAKLMQKWLGQTWEEVMERTAEKREEQRKLDQATPGQGDGEDQEGTESEEEQDDGSDGEDSLEDELPSRATKRRLS
ncbi:hypothetical protein GQ53DRAFT_777961 [Thozetella sp. PMI_491]|nr:hypothetical protein GQ53DRAFT_777961 [Thozetella sp. PMI_491]